MQIFSRSPRARSRAEIAAAALVEARRGVYDVLIVDTAGRLHVDAELMQEVKDIDAAVTPHERLFVVDAMAGQDAVNSARAFGEALALTGVILPRRTATRAAAWPCRRVRSPGNPYFRGHGRENRGTRTL